MGDRIRRVCLFVALVLPGLVVVCGPSFSVGRDSAQEKGVLRATLANGLRVVIVRNTLAPVVTTVVNYLVGSNEAPQGFPGMAHAQEHMMFRGSPGLSAAQLSDIIAAMGGVFDAATQQTVTQYFFVIPSHDLDVALHIEAIRMRGVLDSERLWKQERGAIEQEVAQDFSSPDFIFYTKVMAEMFRGTPYAHTPLGSVPSFQKTTGAMLKEFYETWYAPNNAILVIAGDVDPQQALRQVKSFFEDIPPKKLPERPVIHLQPVTHETLHLKTDQSYGMAVISFRMPGYKSADYAASQVLADALNSQRSDLFALVPEGKALYAGFSLNPLPDAGLGFAMAAFPVGADPAGLVKEVESRLAAAAEKGLPADLIQAAKRIRRTKAELKKNSIMDQAMAWSQALSLEGRESPEDMVRAIERVSSEEVNRVARAYLRMDRAVVTVLTPEASGKPVTSKRPGTLESFTPQHVKPVKLPDWAAKALSRLSVPTSTTRPVASALPNGLKLIVLPESMSDTVSVYGHIRNNADMETPPGEEGVDQVLDQLFAYGCESLDRLAFQKALDDIGAKESAGTDFSLQVLTSHFERGVELLAENELHPAFSEQAFKTVREQVAATVKGRLQSPDYLTKRALKAGLLPNKDPALRKATPASVSSLTLQDVEAYHQKVYRPDLTVIVVAGNITPKKARAVIEKYFGSWKAEGPKPPTLLPSLPINKPSAVNIPDARRIQDKVVLAQTLGLTRTNPDYYSLELGNHVLGGAFYATRLYRDLREQTGLVYYVSSTFDVGRTRSTYSVEFGCDPDKVGKARTIVQYNLSRMQREAVPQAELMRAKALLLRQIPLSESTIDTIAQKLIYYTTHNLPLDEATRAARRYLKLTAQQVKEAFARWVRPHDLVQVSEGPSPG